MTKIKEEPSTPPKHRNRLPPPPTLLPKNLKKLSLGDWKLGRDVKVKVTLKRLDFRQFSFKLGAAKTEVKVEPQSEPDEERNFGAKKSSARIQSLTGRSAIKVFPQPAQQIKVSPKTSPKNSPTNGKISKDSSLKVVLALAPANDAKDPEQMATTKTVDSPPNKITTLQIYKEPSNRRPTPFTTSDNQRTKPSEKSQLIFQNVKIIITTLKPQLNCKYCGREFFNHGGLRLHYMHAHLDQEGYKCKVCSKSFRSRLTLKGHTLSHYRSASGIFNYTQTNLEFLRHQEKSDPSKTDNPKSYPCHICKQNCESSEKLGEHIVKAHPKKPESSNKPKKNIYICSICKRKCSSNADLCQHLLKFHPITGSPRGSPQSVSVARAKTHTTTNTTTSQNPPPKNLYTCTICNSNENLNVNFPTCEELCKHILQTHKPRRSEERDESSSDLVVESDTTAVAPKKKKECKVCNKKFATNQTLKYHVMIHSGEKPNVCTFCNKSFRKPETLGYHLRMHTRERPYPCKEKGCGHAARTKSQLNVHVKTHRK